MKFKFSPEVEDAIAGGHPVVALESTVIAHGLPHPQNLETAYAMEDAVRKNGAVPATIAILGGVPTVGLAKSELEHLAVSKDILKVSVRDIPAAVAAKADGATTVAGTMFIAHRAGIKVFATGGIGGVHRGTIPDISADLPVLAATPMTIVCAGAKIVLDLEATREWLETHSVTVLGWQTSEFPAFYTRKSGLSVDMRVDSEDEICRIVEVRDRLGLKNAVLVAVPVPFESEIDASSLDPMLETAIGELAVKKVTGKEITPFLLSRLSDLSEGRTLESNISLLLNNAAIAARIACGIS